MPKTCRTCDTASQEGRGGGSWRKAWVARCWLSCVASGGKSRHHGAGLRGHTGEGVRERARRPTAWLKLLASFQWPEETLFAYVMRLEGLLQVATEKGAVLPAITDQA
ncbi:hypothetical protein MC885_008276 [Smutsia gigantea]|nr:hypothetical protein MC885_008276 [Smutsia gigantea]